MPHQLAARPLSIPQLGAPPALHGESRAGEHTRVSPGINGASTMLISCLHQCWVLLVLDNAGTAWHRLLQCSCGVLVCPFALLNCPCSRDGGYGRGQHVPHQGSGLSWSLWVLLGMQWISNQLPHTWRGCAKLGAPLTHPDFGGVCVVVTIPLACTLRHELTQVSYFCRQQSGRTWRKMQLFPMAETNLPSLTAAAKRARYLSLFLAILFLPTRPQGLNHSSPKAKSRAWASSPATPCCHPANNRLGVAASSPTAGPEKPAGLGVARKTAGCRAEPGLGAGACWLPALSPQCCSGKNFSGSFQTANPKGACVVETCSVKPGLAA